MSAVMSAVEQLAGLIDKQADLMLRIAEAVGRLDRRDEIEELRQEVRALSNRIESVYHSVAEAKERLA